MFEKIIMVNWTCVTLCPNEKQSGYLDQLSHLLLRLLPWLLRLKLLPKVRSPSSSHKSSTTASLCMTKIGSKNSTFQFLRRIWHRRLHVPQLQFNWYRLAGDRKWTREQYYKSFWVFKTKTQILFYTIPKDLITINWI